MGPTAQREVTVSPTPALDYWVSRTFCSILGTTWQATDKSLPSGREDEGQDEHGALSTQQIGASHSHGRSNRSPFLLYRTGAHHVAEAGPRLAELLWPLFPKCAGLQASATTPDLERVFLVSTVIREGGLSSQLVPSPQGQLL